MITQRWHLSTCPPLAEKVSSLNFSSAQTEEID
jgi:hypothetical protein